MADANTSLYKFVKPEVGASADTWGAKLNTDFDGVDKLLGAITTAGSANAYTLTTGQSLAAYATGQRFRLKLSFSNTGSATLNVDSIGAKTIKKRDASTNVSSGDLASGAIVTVTYDGTNFVLETNLASDLSFQPLDATLTAFAAQTTGADLLWYWTGTDAGTTMSLPSASRTQIAAGLGTAALVADGTSGAAYGKLNADLTFSGANTHSGVETFTANPVIKNSAASLITYKRADGTTAYLFGRSLSSDDGQDFFLYDSIAGASVFTVNSSRVMALAARPTFNGNTALDTNNGAQLAGTNTFTGSGAFSGAVTLVYANPRLVVTNNSGTTTTVNVSADSGAGWIGSTTNHDFSLYANTTQYLIVKAAGDVQLSSSAIAPASDYSVGYRRFCPASITTGTPAATDSGKCIYATGSITAPNSVFSKGDNITVLAGGSSRTITQGSGVTMTNGNTGAAGSCTLAANGMCVIVWTSSSDCTVFGNV